jgi:hypothetical protein
MPSNNIASAPRRQVEHPCTSTPKIGLMREQSSSDVAIINDVTATKIRDAMLALGRLL